MTAIAEALAQARSLAIQTLTDTVRVTRRGDTPVSDDLGTQTWPWVAIYEGPGLVQALTQQSNLIDTAGQAKTLSPHVLKVAVGADVKIGDRIEVVDSLTPDHHGPWWVTATPTQGWGILERHLLSSAEPDRR